MVVFFFSLSFLISTLCGRLSWPAGKYTIIDWAYELVFSLVEPTTLNYEVELAVKLNNP